jgi:bifunctional non-homologous end joining protein LigD
VFRLHGEKLAGLWELVRIRKPGEQRQDPWLLFKKKDEWARPLSEYDVVSALPDSVIAKPLRPIEARETRATGARTRNESRLLPEQLEGAVKAALPRKLSPQLATLSKTVPSGRDWLCEIKFDGYRVMARIDKREVRLVTRGGHDWSAKMKSLASAVAALDLQSTWLDGEIVVMNGDGVPDFNALQNAFDSARTDSIVYYLFDLPHFEGYDLRRVPLHQRRALLRQLLEAKAAGDRIRFSEEFPGDVASVLAQVCRLRLEGVIAKRPEAPYVSERTEAGSS